MDLKGRAIDVMNQMELTQDMVHYRALIYAKFNLIVIYALALVNIPISSQLCCYYGDDM